MAEKALASNSRAREAPPNAVINSENSVTDPAPAVEFVEGHPPVQAPSASKTSLRAIALVVCCTVIGAAAQIFIRSGAESVDASAFLFGLWGNWNLLAGFACLGLNTALLILALRDGHLSVLYPIIALTYVWVTILSPMFFPDAVNAFKLTGVVFIVLGVSLIGAGGRS